MDAVLSVWDKEHVGVRLSPNGGFNDMGADDFVKPLPLLLNS